MRTTTAAVVQLSAGRSVPCQEPQIPTSDAKGALMAPQLFRESCSLLGA